MAVWHVHFGVTQTRAHARAHTHIHARAHTFPLSLSPSLIFPLFLFHFPFHPISFLSPILLIVFSYLSHSICLSLSFSSRPSAPFLSLSSVQDFFVISECSSILLDVRGLVAKRHYCVLLVIAVIELLHVESECSVLNKLLH